MLFKCGLQNHDTCKFPSFRQLYCHSSVFPPSVYQYQLVKPGHTTCSKNAPGSVPTNNQCVRNCISKQMHNVWYWFLPFTQRKVTLILCMVSIQILKIFGMKYMYVFFIYFTNTWPGKHKIQAVSRITAVDYYNSFPIRTRDILLVR